MADDKTVPDGTRIVLDGIPRIRRGKFWMPDYSKPETAELIRKSVDEVVDAHHSIDKTRQ